MEKTRKALMWAVVLVLIGWLVYFLCALSVKQNQNYQEGLRLSKKSDDLYSQATILFARESLEMLKPYLTEYQQGIYEGRAYGSLEQIKEVALDALMVLRRRINESLTDGPSEADLELIEKLAGFHLQIEKTHNNVRWNSLTLEQTKRSVEEMKIILQSMEEACK